MPPSWALAAPAMLMAMAGWDRFWIANVIYLAFVLSAVLGSIAKIGMYHGRLPRVINAWLFLVRLGS